ncbi:hypothetical protein E2C01_100094 [Portunus trituberculatus]|uniref:Uncharacterized protein n=1 Tax=Portunus trituberculatus TaxID=210409 RepID=A0A5B7KGI8_PORTR|nr:hypothetical protein [Portunus trituberculatus]
MRQQFKANHVSSSIITTTTTTSTTAALSFQDVYAFVRLFLSFSFLTNTTQLSLHPPPHSAISLHSASVLWECVFTDLTLGSLKYVKLGKTGGARYPHSTGPH